MYENEYEMFGAEVFEVIEANQMWPINWEYFRHENPLLFLSVLSVIKIEKIIPHYFLPEIPK